MDPKFQKDRQFETGKKTYAAPRLCVYGDIVSVTRAISNTTKNSDGGKGGTNKTN